MSLPSPEHASKLIGVGGGGGNAVNRMIDAGIEGIDFVVANTDLQALKRSRASVKIQLGGRLTKGLGAGADPEVGRQAALEDTDKIIEVLEGSDMVFVTTGSAEAPAQGARRLSLRWPPNWGRSRWRLSPNRLISKAGAVCSRQSTD